MKKTIVTLCAKGIGFCIGIGAGRLPLVRRCYHLLLPFIKKLSRKSTVVVDGHTMRLDAKDSLDLTLYGSFEPNETAVVKNYVKPGQTVIDIGANIGYYTLTFARLVGDRGAVHAFEPFPDNFSILKSNVETNGYTNVRLIQKAVADATAPATLFLNPENNGMHSITAVSARSIAVESVALDEYFPGNEGPVHFIKLDIEGAELKALRGMRGLLGRQSDIAVLLEFAPVNMERPQTQGREMLELLVKSGFALHRVDKAGELRATSVGEVLENYTYKKKNHANLLCIKRS